MEPDSKVASADKLRRDGKTEEALRIYQDFLKEGGDSYSIGCAQLGIAVIYYRKGEVYKAQRFLMDAISSAEQAGDPTLLTRCHTTAINIYSSIGDISSCERHIKLGKKYVNDAENTSRFNFYNLLGIFYFDRGKIGLAERYWTQCLEISQKINDTELVAIAYNNLGEVYRVHGKAKKALDYYTRAYENSKSLEDYRGMAINLLNMGDVERDLDDLKMAEKYARESAGMYNKHKDRRIGASSYSMLAEILADAGKVEEALNAAKKARELATNAGELSLQGEALLSMGYAYEKMGKLRDALKNYNEAREIFTKINNRVYMSECELAAGRVLLAGDKKDAARFHLEKAKKIASEIGEFKVTQKAEALLSKC